MGVKIIIIGLGGIGGALANLVWKGFNHPETLLVLIDGDSYEERNAGRQYFTQIGYNKARSWSDRIDAEGAKCETTPIDTFFDPNNINNLQISNDDIVLLCVDNHRARKFVNDICKKLNRITLISGGNEYWDGNVQFFVNVGGELVAGDYLDTYHPEINEAEAPKEDGCDTGDGQLLMVNSLVASVMFCLLSNITRDLIPTYSEVYLDAKEMKVEPVTRR